MLFSDSHTHSVFSFDGHDGIPDLLNAAEKAVVLPAVNAVRQPLHGGEIVVHTIVDS